MSRCPLVLVASALALAGGASCGDNEIGAIAIVAPASVVEPVRGIAALAPATAAIEVRESADPAGELVPDRDLRIGVVVDLDCVECYRIDPVADGAWLVHTG